MSKEIKDWGFGIIETKETYYTEDEINQLKQQLERLQTELHMKVDYIHELLEVKDDYKQQLHDLPKKIIEEIIEELKTLYKNDPIIYTENKDIVKGCYDKDSVNKILDTILKKYGGENESV